MIKVGVFYPAGADTGAGDAVKAMNQLDGKVPYFMVLAGGAPGAPATYVAMAHLYFDSVDAFQKAFSPHAGPIMADIPNYTNIQPVIQISELKS